MYLTSSSIINLTNCPIFPRESNNRGSRFQLPRRKESNIKQGNAQSASSPQSWCLVFFQKFWLPMGLHSICSISPTASRTCQNDLQNIMTEGMMPCVEYIVILANCSLRQKNRLRPPRGRRGWEQRPPFPWRRRCRGPRCKCSCRWCRRRSCWPRTPSRSPSRSSRRLKAMKSF